MLDLDLYLQDSPYNVNLKAKLRALSDRFEEPRDFEFLIEGEDKELLIKAFYYYRQFGSSRKFAIRPCLMQKQVIKKIQAGQKVNYIDICDLIGTCIDTEIDDMCIKRAPDKNFKIDHPHIIAHGFADWINILLEHENTFNRVALTIQGYLSNYFDDECTIKFSTIVDRDLFCSEPELAGKPIFSINPLFKNTKSTYTNKLLVGTNYPFKLIFLRKGSTHDIEKPEDWKKHVLDFIDKIDGNLLKQIIRKLERKIDELELAPNARPNPVITNLIDKYQKEEREETLEAQRMFLMDHQNHYDRLLETINKIMKDKWGFDLAIKLMKTCDNHIGMPNERIRFNLKTEWSSCDIILFGVDYPYQVYLEEDEEIVRIKNESDWEKIAVYFVTHPPKNLREKTLN